MAYIKKKIRERVWNKYDKRCAYCGTELEYKQMQVDHIEAHWHGGTEEDCKRWGVTKGEHEESNFKRNDRVGLFAIPCVVWRVTSVPF